MMGTILRALGLRKPLPVAPDMKQDQRRARVLAGEL